MIALSQIRVTKYTLRGSTRLPGVSEHEMLVVMEKHLRTFR